MIYNKKGLIEDVLAKVILVIAVALILFAIIGKFIGTIEGGGDIEICRLSVIAQSKTKFFGSSPVNLDCKRREVVFYNNYVKINGKPATEYKFNELDDYFVNKVLAEELRICWHQMGQGKIEVFRSDAAYQAENVCVVCSEISFDQSVKKEKFEGLIDFLKTTPLPNTKKEDKKYYYNYLQESQKSIYIRLGVNNPLPWTNHIVSWVKEGTTDRIHDQPIQKEKRYVVWFLGWKPGAWNEDLAAFSSAYYIGITEPQELIKSVIIDEKMDPNKKNNQEKMICDRLVN